MQTLRKFYPDSDLFINVDYEGDVDGYTKVGEELGATVTRNNFQLGYCGNFGDRDIGYDYWSKEKALEWLRGVYAACKKTDSKYMMLFEEDDQMMLAPQPEFYKYVLGIRSYIWIKKYYIRTEF